MKIKVLSIITIVIFFSSVAHCQKPEKKIIIAGWVKDSLQNPVKGAVIYIDNKKTSGVTDNLGNFKVKVKPDAVKIKVLSPANVSGEAFIDGRTKIDFTLSVASKSKPGNIDNQEKEETVDVGYGTRKKKDLISGKASVSKPRFSSYTNIYDMIRNELSGVQVRGTTVIVQGITSFQGSSEALFVVDGIIVNQINDVAPSDVKSIELLKGPATVVYGMQGANGVILIKTIRGTDKQ